MPSESIGNEDDCQKNNTAGILQAEEIGNIAFEFSAQKTTLEERLKQIKESPSSRPDHYSLCRWAAFDDDGTMMGSISTYPYQIRFDGKSVGMSGIGFVSTLPGYRRRGAIRGCFEQAFREMKELGQVFSALYPFSVEYYRQFGYEAGAADSGMDRTTVLHSQL